MYFDNLINDRVANVKYTFMKFKNWTQKNIFETKWKWVAIFLPILMYIIIMSIAMCKKYDLFRIPVYDSCVFFQAIWKIANLKGLSNTITGISIWGDHLTFTILLYVPFYKIFPSIYTLFILQSFVLAIGGYGIYLISKEKLSNGIIAFIFMMIYLFYPATQHSNLGGFYPELISTTFAIFAFYFMMRKKYVIFWIFFLLGILSKEDVALTYSFFAIYIFFKNNKKVGLVAFIICVIYFLLSMFLFLKLFNGYGFFRFSTLSTTGSSFAFGDFYKNKFNIFFHINSIFREESLIYFFKLLLPLCFLSLLDFPILFIAFPAIFINVTTRSDFYLSLKTSHYNVSIIPFVFISAIYGFSKLLEINRDYKNTLNKKSPINIYGATFMLLCCSLISYYSLFDLGSKLNKYFERNKVEKPLTTETKNIIDNKKDRLAIKTNDEINDAIEAIKLIPKDASVSASTYMVAHLINREKIYWFSNPFKNNSYGLDYSIDNFDLVDYIVFNKYEYHFSNLDSEKMEKMENIFVAIMNSSDYDILFHKNDTYVLKLKRSNTN